MQCLKHFLKLEKPVIWYAKKVMLSKNWFYNILSGLRVPWVLSSKQMAIEFANNILWKIEPLINVLRRIAVKNPQTNF